MSRTRKLAIAFGATGLLVLLGFGSCWMSLYPPRPPDRPARSVYLRDVTLLSPGAPDGEVRREHRSLVIRNGRITEVGPANPVEGDRYGGMFVMPGLVDLHVHWPPPAIPGQMELFAFLHLYHGVTTVRSLGDNFEGASFLARDGIEKGRFPGPRVLTCGRIVDGDPPLWRGSRVVAHPDEAPQAVAELAESGVDCIKAYDELTAESVAALREAAHAAGLPIVGHVPRRVAYDVAKLDDAQHLRGMHPAFPGAVPAYPRFLEAWLTADDAHFAAIAQGSLAAGIAHTPTLVTTDRLARSGDWGSLAAEPAYRLLPRWYRDALWDADTGLNAARTMAPEDFTMVAAAFERMKTATVRMHAAGVAIHTGTDTMAPGVVPGAALHRELRILVEAGLSPEQALAASTRASASFLEIEGLGEIRPGAPADLLVLRRDPTLDLSSLDSIEAVIVDGRFYRREVLDRHLAAFRERFERFGQRVVATHTLRLAFGRLLPLLFAGGPAGTDPPPEIESDTSR